MKRNSWLIVTCAALVSLAFVVVAVADEKKGKTTDEDMKVGPEEVEETLFCFALETVQECFGFGPNVKEALEEIAAETDGGCVAKSDYEEFFTCPKQILARRYPGVTRPALVNS